MYKFQCTDCTPSSVGDSKIFLILIKINDFLLQPTESKKL